MKTSDELAKELFPETHHFMKAHLELLKGLYPKPNSHEDKTEAKEELCKKT